MLVTEMWMDRVARMTDKPLHSIRHLNLYKEKERTHFGQILHGSQIQVWFDILPPFQLTHAHRLMQYVAVFLCSICL